MYKCNVQHPGHTQQLGMICGFGDNTVALVGIEHDTELTIL